MTKWVLGLGILVVAALILVASLNILSWVVAGVLLAATIGVTGWVLNYESKPKEKIAVSKNVPKKHEPEPPRESIVILEETCVLKSKEYVSYDIDLDQQRTVKGEITSDKPISFYFLSGYSFSLYENDEDFSYDYGAEDILEKKINFTPMKTATRYVVAENEGKYTATVKIRLFV
jgi:hypothetical protein